MDILDGIAPLADRRPVGHPAQRPHLAQKANPLHWVSPSAPPFQISHGTGDVLVSHGQSARLHEALTGIVMPEMDGIELARTLAVEWAKDGRTGELYLLQGYRHGFLNPPGRLDVEVARVMDDGRLAAEGAASAVHRTSRYPDAPEEATTFGFTDVEAFFRRHLGHDLAAQPMTGDSR